MQNINSHREPGKENGTKIRIGLDIDGVLADYISALLLYAQERGFDVPKSKDGWSEWNGPNNCIAPILKTITKDEVEQLFRSCLPCAQPDNWDFKPFAYVTARSVHSDVTGGWLWKHGFPYAPVFTVERGNDKLEVLDNLEIDLFIDDRSDTVDYLEANGIHCLVFDQPWNQDCQAERIYDLGELNG